MIDNFIVKVFAAGILSALQTQLVYGNPEIINNKYEGEIANGGDTVKIRTLGDVTIDDYDRNTDMAAPETLSDAALELKIDQEKSFNFQEDDLDALQADADLSAEAEQRVAYGLRKEMDSFIASLHTDIDTGNFVGTDASPKTDLGTAGQAYKYLTDLGVLLDESDTPEEDRWAIVPPWYHQQLELDTRFTGFGTAENRATLANGKIGMAAGFTIYKSNQVPYVTSTTKFKVIGGHKMAWSKAEQLVKTEKYRLERRFADGVKGLHVYGAKVIRPSNLAVAVCNRP